MILANLLLALAWVGLNGRFTLDSLIVGALIGRVVLVVLAKGGVLPGAEVGRVERAVSLLLYLLCQIVVANVRLTKDVLSIRHRMRPGVIQVPLSVTTDAEILLLSAMINITPGSVALDVSEDRQSMYVHVMHISTTVEEAKREIKNGFERRILDLRGEKRGLIDAS
jgi:multicomponent Na+:H+ antiporter subunit E